MMRRRLRQGLLRSVPLDSVTPVRGAIIEATSVDAPACLDSPTVPADEAGIVYGTITDSLGRPVRGTARLNWTAIGHARGSNFQGERNVSAMDGFFRFCNINVGPTLTLLVFDSEGRASEPVKLRLQPRQPWAAMHRTIDQ